MQKDHNKQTMTRSRTGSALAHDWEELLKNEGVEFSFKGDRNSKRNACSQYFQRHGIKVRVYSRYVGNEVRLMVTKVRGKA